MCVFLCACVCVCVCVCECEGVLGEKCGGVGGGRGLSVGCGGGKGRCVWEGRGSVEAQDSSKRKMSLGGVGGREKCVWEAWRGVGGWVGGCVCV